MFLRDVTSFLFPSAIYMIHRMLDFRKLMLNHRFPSIWYDMVHNMMAAELEEEFIYLLTHFKQPLEQEVLSFRSTEDGRPEYFSIAKFMFLNGYDKDELTDSTADLCFSEISFNSCAIQSYTSSNAVARGELSWHRDRYVNLFWVPSLNDFVRDSILLDTNETGQFSPAI
ncbi:hypothetical protein ACJX0J_018040 [Zea mays]